MTFLGTLPSEGVEITVEGAFFETTKKRVHESFDRLKNGSERLYDIEVVEKTLGELNFQEAKNKVYQQYNDLVKSGRKAYTIEEVEAI